MFTGLDCVVDTGFILSGKHGKVREFKVIWKTHGKVREIGKKKQYFNVFMENYKFQYYTQKRMNTFRNEI
jgi:hypothetical protein